MNDGNEVDYILAMGKRSPARDEIGGCEFVSAIWQWCETYGRLPSVLQACVDYRDQSDPMVQGAMAYQRLLAHAFDELHNILGVGLNYQHILCDNTECEKKQYNSIKIVK